MDNPEHPVPDQGIPSNSSKDLGLTGGPSSLTHFVQVGLAQIMERIHIAYEKYLWCTLLLLSSVRVKGWVIQSSIRNCAG